MKLRFVGIGNAYNHRFNNTIGFFNDDSNLVFIDAGKGLTDFLIDNQVEAPDTIGKIDKYTFLITHMHPDHVCELGMAIMFIHYELGCNDIEIFGPKELEEFLRLMGVKDDMYKVKGNGKIEGRTFHANKVQTNHVDNLISYGFLVYFNEGGGFYYSGDTKEFNTDMLELLESGHIDCIYHEATPFEDEKHTFYKDIMEVVDIDTRDNIYLIHLDKKSNIFEYINQGFSIAQEVDEIE